MPRKKAGATDDSADGTGTNQAARRTPWEVVVVASAFYARRKVVFAPCDTVPMKSEKSGTLVDVELTENLSVRLSERMKQELWEESCRRSSLDSEVSQGQIVREALDEYLDVE